MVDDLVTRGVDEPYRLFTSRSEYRLLLRQDNALRRMMPMAERHGLLTDDERRAADRMLRRQEEVLELASDIIVDPDGANTILCQAGSSVIDRRQRLATLARRPGTDTRALFAVAGIVLEPDDVEWADLELKYQGYLERERTQVKRMAAMDGLSLDPDLDYRTMHALAFEARERLAEARPLSLGQASRLPGVSPSDVQCLLREVLRSGSNVSRETKAHSQASGF
jgi:tRNA uridine 5-carboxymethylaminomethyl modification enzyme